MKNYLIFAIAFFFMASPLFGQSADEKRFSFRSALIAHALTYNLDKQNGVGFHFGQFTFVVTFLNNGRSVITTDDGSTYTYSGLGLSIVGGYNWYFENGASLVLGAGPLYSSESKENENIKSEEGFGTDADERIENLNFLPLVPLLFLVISFKLFKTCRSQNLNRHSSNLILAGNSNA